MEQDVTCISWLDPIQKQGLRLSLGSFRLSPALSLCVGVSWLPFRTRGEKLEQFSGPTESAICGFACGGQPE